MNADGRDGWNGFWFAEEPWRNIAAARILLAATALWVVLSRFDLPSVLQFPPEMLTYASPAVRLRFAIVFPIAVERFLYALLHLSLLATLFAIRIRICAFASGVLLYHFQPFETLIWTSNPYLRGLTIPALGLFILSFFPEIDLRDAATVPRWPLALIQVLVAELYFFAGYSKLITSGFQWASHENIRRWLLLLEQAYGPTNHPWGYWAASVPLMPEAIGWFGIAFELLFPVTLLWRRTRIVFIPLAVMFHLANAVMFHIVLQELSILLVFVDWQAVTDRMRR